MKFYHLIMFSVLATLLAGCGDNGSSDNGPALLIDLTAVGQALGRNEMINKQITATEKDLQKQLNTIATDLNKKIKTEQDKLTSKSKDKDKQRVNEFTKQAQQTMRNKRLEAQQKVNQLKVNLLNKFREEIKMEAEPIAQDLGANMVMFINSDTLWFDPEIDITDEVIAKMRAKK